MIDWDEIILSWPSAGVSADSHLGLEIAEAFRRGKPLNAYEPVPGCSCVSCTGVIPKAPQSLLSPASSITDAQIAKARAYPILSALDRLGYTTVRRGARYTARCPIHDDRTPSTDITPSRNLWYCFVCAEGGDVIRLWMLANKVSFADAVRALAS